MNPFEIMDKRLLIFGSLFGISNRLQTLMDKTMEELTAKQWFVLTMLELFEEPPSLIELATSCDSSYQNVKQIVLKLEDKGFVTLENNKWDKRAKCIVMTSKCGQWEKSNRENATNFINNMFSPFSPQQIDELSSSLLSLYENLGEISNKK